MKTLDELRHGNVVTLDKIPLQMIEGPIRKGDFYVAGRNTGPKLLIAREDEDTLNGWVKPEGTAYVFDLHECVRVKEAA